MESRGEVQRGSVRGVDGRTVLIVEDEWLVRMELVAAFEDEGCAVFESASAEDALTHLRGGSCCDLLVTDIRLGGALSGWDLAGEARALDPGIAVIYVSANPAALGRDVDGSVFIDKPALIGQVIATARQLLGT
jgi:CheY-like chemotaxis protein